MSGARAIPNPDSIKWPAAEIEASLADLRAQPDRLTQYQAKRARESAWDILVVRCRKGENAAEVRREYDAEIAKINKLEGGL